MTPLHLDILMHYYTRGGDYEMINKELSLSNQTRHEYAYYLAQKGLLYTGYKANQVFFITEHGKQVFEKIIKHFSELLNCEL